MKKYDVFGIGNALVDCVCMVDDSFLVENNIEKGVMTLVDEEKQKLLIEKIKNIKPFIQSGGSVTNSIFALSQLGGSGYSSFLVSDDEFGNIYINDLKNNGVKTGGIKYTIADGINFVYCDTSAVGITVNLPAAINRTKFIIFSMFYVKILRSLSLISHLIHFSLLRIIRSRSFF